MKYQDKQASLEQLKQVMQDIVTDRDWQQFHSPKNLALKLVIESSELLEKFEWMSEQDSFAKLTTHRKEIEDEAADVLMVLLCFCNAAKIDLASAMMSKVSEVTAKYPIDKAKGIYTKYNKL